MVAVFVIIVRTGCSVQVEAHHHRHHRHSCRILGRLQPPNTGGHSGTHMPGPRAETAQTSVTLSSCTATIQS